MSPDNEREPVARPIKDRIELEDFVARQDRNHQDQYGQHSHELSEEGAEASSRLLIRVVPLAYGGLLGGLSDHLALGLAAGAALSMGFDLKMREHSMVRGAARRLSVCACPGIAYVAHRLAALLRRLGLAAPAALSEIRCGASPS